MSDRTLRPRKQMASNQSEKSRKKVSKKRAKKRKGEQKKRDPIQSPKREEDHDSDTELSSSTSQPIRGIEEDQLALGHRGVVYVLDLFRDLMEREEKQEGASTFNDHSEEYVDISKRAVRLLYYYARNIQLLQDVEKGSVVDKAFSKLFGPSIDLGPEPESDVESYIKLDGPVKLGNLPSIAKALVGRYMKAKDSEEQEPNV
jgi:hypothetical protein